MSSQSRSTCFYVNHSLILLAFYISVQPEIKLHGLEITTFRQFTTVTVTCIIDRLYPAVDPSAFQMLWGSVSKDATRIENKDSTYRYKVQVSQMVTMENNGMNISCTVKPIYGNAHSVTKGIVVHGSYISA